MSHVRITLRHEDWRGMPNRDILSAQRVVEFTTTCRMTRHSGHQPFSYARVRFSDDYVYGFGETEGEQYVALMGKLGCV